MDIRIPDDEHIQQYERANSTENNVALKIKELSGGNMIIFILICICIICCCCSPVLYLTFRCSWKHKGGWADTVFILLLSCVIGIFTGGIGIVPLVLIIWFVSFVFGIDDWSCPISGKGGIREMRAK